MKFPSNRPDLELVDTCFQQWMPYAVLGSRSEPRPPVADVVRVCTRKNRSEPAALRKQHEPVVELGLAVIAAIAPVRDVLRTPKLVCTHDLVGDTDRSSDIAGTPKFSRSKRRRHRSDRQCSVPESASRKARNHG